jgi:hypothetical protein
VSKIGAALSAMLFAVETLEEARDAVKAIPRPLVDGAESALLERVVRRIENAAAQVELDRRLVEELVREAHDAGLP